MRSGMQVCMYVIYRAAVPKDKTSQTPHAGDTSKAEDSPTAEDSRKAQDSPSTT